MATSEECNAMLAQKKYGVIFLEILLSEQANKINDFNPHYSLG